MDDGSPAPGEGDDLEMAVESMTDEEVNNEM